MGEEADKLRRDGDYPDSAVGAEFQPAPLTTVELRQAGGRLTFLVTDDDAGFDLAGPVTGSGLQGMRDRLAALDGSLTVGSAPGRGTKVSAPCRASLPSPASPRPADLRRMPRA